MSLLFLGYFLTFVRIYSEIHMETLSGNSILGSMSSQNDKLSVILFTMWYILLLPSKFDPPPPYTVWLSFMLTMWPQQHLAYHKEEKDVHGCWNSFVTFLWLFGPFIKHLASLFMYNWTSHGVNIRSLLNEPLCCTCKWVGESPPS